MQNQAQRTRDNYMRLARNARTAERAEHDGNHSFGVTQFYRPVAYYVQQARGVNRRTK